MMHAHATCRSADYRDDAQTSSVDVNGTLAPHHNNDRNDRLTTWFQVWHGPMRRWVSSRSSMRGIDLDDLAQEVFLRLMKYSDDVVIQSPQSYLFRIATNIVNEWRERARNSLPHDNAWLDDLQIEPDDEPERSVERSLVSEQVRGAVERLPQRQREILLLHIHDDLTCQQIADHLQLTRRMVRRDIAHAYAQLRWELGAVDLDGLDAPKEVEEKEEGTEHPSETPVVLLDGVRPQGPL